MGKIVRFWRSRDRDLSAVFIGSVVPAVIHSFTIIAGWDIVPVTNVAISFIS